MTTNNAAYLTRLHQLLSDYFNLAGIQDLCFQLDVETVVSLFTNSVLSKVAGGATQYILKRIRK